MLHFLITIGIIFTLMFIWIKVQKITRCYALAHPEWGQPKEEGLGCGKNCGCQQGHCKN